MAFSAASKWALVLVAVTGFVVLGAVTLAGLGAYVLFSHIDVARDTNRAEAEREFAEARRRFEGTSPLLTLDENRHPQVRRPGTPSPTEPQMLHIMAWDPDEDRLIRLRLPFWLLRLGKDGDVRFDTADGDPFSLDLTVEDLERHGPGLILDHADESDDQVLVWSE